MSSKRISRWLNSLSAVRPKPQMPVWTGDGAPSPVMARAPPSAMIQIRAHARSPIAFNRFGQTRPFDREGSVEPAFHCRKPPTRKLSVRHRFGDQRIRCVGVVPSIVRRTRSIELARSPTACWSISASALVDTVTLLRLSACQTIL